MVTSLTLPEIFEWMTGLQVDERRFCIGYSSFAYFMLSYASVGSMGIAIYRVMYIRVIIVSKSVDVHNDLKKVARIRF